MTNFKEKAFELYEALRKAEIAREVNVKHGTMITDEDQQIIEEGIFNQWAESLIGDLEPHMVDVTFEEISRGMMLWMQKHGIGKVAVITANNATLNEL